MKRSKLIISGTLLGAITIAALISCRSIPKGLKAVKPFDSKRYLGQWYEIARFDFRFEKNLNNTTANYSFNDDGTIKVVNKGFNYKTNKWKEATGKAKFVGDTTEAKLKVSFFGPFYSGYNVLAIDPDYKYALVAGKSRDYLWILSREKTIPQKIKEDYLAFAEKSGFNTSRLLWVEHNK